jgi:nicotinamidase/pyrazinamidase
MRPAFLDVDTQVDFVEPAGKLYARGAEKIKPNLARLVSLAQTRGIPLVASADAHTDGDPEFALYPPHCLRGTKGQEKVAETRREREVVVESRRASSLPDPRKEAVVLEKQVFPVFGNENAELILARTGADTFYVFGVVTEVCVKAAALGLLDRGYAVKLVEDAIWPIEAAAGEKAKQEMVARGAELVSTAEVVDAFAPSRGARR